MSNSDASLIGLTDLIARVKSDLQSSALDPSSEVPVFRVSAVELELQVVLKDEGSAGIKLYVASLGGSTSRSDVQKVKVSLEPLLEKKELVNIYKARYPDQWKEFLETASDTVLKGDEDTGL